MKSIAIIGTGIAGLGCAHLLRGQAELRLFEKESRVGGHSNTLLVDEQGEEIAIDSGFMVYNEVTYPLLTGLFAELGVETDPSDMSFSVQHRPSGLEYCGSSMSQLFAQRRNLFRPRHYRMLARIDRFHREAVAALDDPAFSSVTLAEYVAARGYGSDFLERFLIPMSAAVWSTPFRQIMEFPATTLLRFFHNHGFLGMDTQHPWRTVRGGSRKYVEKLTQPFRDRIETGDPVVAVRRNSDGAEVRLRSGATARFDQVVFAAHADETLAMIADPTPEELRLLSPFHYQSNVAQLHTDKGVMPRTRRAWASWNYRITEIDGQSHGSTVYWMNSLQKVSQRRDYFISIDDPGEVDPASVLQTIVYTHPLFTRDAITAQRELPTLNARDITFFCGSYFAYGFHEDALRSGMEAASALLARNSEGCAA
ncbi:MAG TPA: FAD-dependent oxidoreductase [Thermoanaerobaculia bacterium]|nr:FAD-dependent oxidoreductase [Thermoanaerobaculia bacterium]